MAARDDSIVIDGVTLPTPKKEGLTVTREKIWSSKTGRGTTGEMLGDLVCIKTKLQISWPPLTREQVALIDARVSAPYFSITYSDPATNARKTITAYAGTPSYPVYSYVDGVKTYHGVAVDIIEK